MQHENKNVSFGFWFDIGILLLANILTAIFFLSGKGSVPQVLLTYFVQTALIAVFYFKRINKANTTEVLKESPYSSLRAKVISLLRKNSTEEFLFTLFFFTPLAFLVFLFSNGLFDASPLDVQNISITSILVASVAFLLHHAASYFIELRAYNEGAIEQIKIPYKKLAVRVFTIIAISYIGSSSFVETNSDHLFIVFMIIKTCIDIACSSSLLLLNPKD